MNVSCVLVYPVLKEKTFFAYMTAIPEDYEQIWAEGNFEEKKSQGWGTLPILFPV